MGAHCLQKEKPAMNWISRQCPCPCVAQLAQRHTSCVALRHRSHGTPAPSRRMLICPVSRCSGPPPTASTPTCCAAPRRASCSPCSEAGSSAAGGLLAAAAPIGGGGPFLIQTLFGLITHVSAFTPWGSAGCVGGTGETAPGGCAMAIAPNGLGMTPCGGCGDWRGGRSWGAAPS